MIVSEGMTTKLITVTTDDTLSHAANLLRQYKFHHLPVVRATGRNEWSGYTGSGQNALPEFQGLLTSQDIDLAAAMGKWSSSEVLHRPWQERLLAGGLEPARNRGTPTTKRATAAQMRGGPG